MKVTEEATGFSLQGYPSQALAAVVAEHVARTAREGMRTEKPGGSATGEPAYGTAAYFDRIRQDVRRKADAGKPSRSVAEKLGLG